MDMIIHLISFFCFFLKKKQILFTIVYRQNPLTYKLYANVYCPTIYKSTNNHHRSPLSRYVAHEHDTSWISRDAITFDNLPEHWKQRRNIYRSLFITECRSLEILDNITITLDERNNALNNVENYIKNE